MDHDTKVALCVLPFVLAFYGWLIYVLLRRAATLPPHVTHVCTTRLTEDGSANSYSGEVLYRCGAERWSDGTVVGARCGEPCSWIMGKAGHGEPPWRNLPGNVRCNPHVPDGHPEAPV